MSDNSAYYRARAAKGRVLARLATTPEVAAIHVETADRYSVMAAQALATEREARLEQKPLSVV